MSGYIWMLLWLLIYTALSAVLEVRQSETVCGVQTVRFTKLWATLGVLPLLIFCTLRGDIGDTYNYMHAFSEMPSTFSALPDYIQSLQKDHGFFLLSALIKLLCGGQVRVGFAFSPRFSSGRSLKTIGFIRKATASVCFCSSLPRITSPG